MHAAAVSKLIELGAARLSFLDSHRPRFNALTLRPWLRFTPHGPGQWQAANQRRSVVSLANQRPGMSPQSDHQTNPCRNQSQFRLFRPPKARFRFHFCGQKSRLSATHDSLQPGQTRMGGLWIGALGINWRLLGRNFYKLAPTFRSTLGHKEV